MYRHAFAASEQAGNLAAPGQMEEGHQLCTAIQGRRMLPREEGLGQLAACQWP